MAVETILALLGAVGAWLWKLLKEGPEIGRGSRKALQDEFNFADTLLAKLRDETVHPFVRERGLQALVGSRTVRGKDIEYILHLNGDARLIRAFMTGRRHLHMDTATSEMRYRFSRFLSNARRRAAFKVAYFMIYLALFCCGAFTLLLFIANPTFFRLEYVAWLASTCFALAYPAALASIGIGCAEQVMLAQEESIRPQNQLDGTLDLAPPATVELVR